MANNESGQTNPQQEDKEALDAASNLKKTSCTKEAKDGKKGSPEKTKVEVVEENEEEDEYEKMYSTAPNRDVKYNQQLWEQSGGIFVPNGYELIMEDDYNAICSIRDQYKESMLELKKRLEAIESKNPKQSKNDANDLADHNRPLKINEMFKQMFEEERVKAIQNLKEQGFDQDTIDEHLVTILRDVDRFCERETYGDLEKVTMVIFKAMGGDESKTPKAKFRQMEFELMEQRMRSGEPKHRHFMMKEIDFLEDDPNYKIANQYAGQVRKDMVALKLGKVKQDFLKQSKIVTQEMLKNKVLADYINQCIKLCWMMQVQTPRMQLIYAYDNEKFNTKFYSYNNERGDYVKSCVWPALKERSDGPILSRGLANSKRKPAPKKK